MTLCPQSAKASSTSSSTTLDIGAHQNLKQHESLWFEDGSIVLTTDVHLYCVHRCVLARNSTVFKDMLELPNVGITPDPNVGGISDGIDWEGKPLVKMVGDSDEDVYRILMVLYDIEFYCVHKPTTLPIILSLLRMSAKYDFCVIRNVVTSHLELLYPNNLNGVEARALGDVFEDFNGEVDDFDFRLLVAALQYNLKTILPMLYFDCSMAPLDYILKAAENLRLEKHQIEKLIHGREEIVKYSYRYVIRRFNCKRHCTPSCYNARTELLEKYMDNLPEYPIQALLRNKEAIDDERLRTSVCTTCSNIISETMEAFRSEVWNSIPELFGLGTWENAKRD
ncbi:hypothetical protein SCHPADRAFT_945018 [Schizopora paradoxa]|uniref:BTB domain-containing protein n=1 Tax=Schizopora paradoxa TaxID=27342 RepID=A0A0H2RSA7_9AGAM|nr:hypothetical protein SCHPADRAFT_945018 [Schizopora paradoxa]